MANQPIGANPQGGISLEEAQKNAQPAAAPQWLGKGQYLGAAAGGDPNKIGGLQGAEIADTPGYAWYHTGALGGNTKFGGNDWIQAKVGAFDNYQPGGPGAAAAPGGVQTAKDAITGQVPAGPPKTPAEAFQQALMSRLNAGPANAQAPELQGVLGANRGAEQRAFERDRAQLAERAAAQGLDPNAMTSQLTGLSQARAQREGQFEGGAVLDLAKQRANELSSALALGGNMLSDIDKSNLQRELAQLQAQISREGLSLQGSLGQADLGLRRSLGEGQLNLGLLNALLGDKQHGSGLAAQLGMHSAGLNQQTLQWLLENS